MTELLMPIGDQSAAGAKPQVTAAQNALLERKALPLGSLLHGAYYKGWADDMDAIGRWHAQRRRFVFRVHDMGDPKLKAAPHVADLGIGTRFAPISKQEPDDGTHISDFALETTR